VGGLTSTHLIIRNKVKLMSKKCKLKYRFKTFAEATTFANTYMEDIVLTFYPMTAFYCTKHKCYHIGHNKYEKRVDKNLESDVV
jgi:hypothetical protein